MKKMVFTLLILISLFGIGTLSTSAQVSDALEFNIPFEFTVAEKTFPAGNYIISPLGNYSEGVFALRDQDHKRESVFLAENTEKAMISQKSELIFDKVGDHYFLSEIFEAGNATGERLPEPRLEKRLEKAAAKEQGIAQLIVVFADAMKVEKLN
jgi:hypothetical protein